MNKFQIQSMLAQSVEAFQSGNLIRSSSILKLILQIDKNNFNALYILGLVKVSDSKYLEAIDLLKKAEKINPRESSIKFNLAKAMLDSGNVKESIYYHKLFLEFAPNNQDGWLNYGKALSQLCKFDEALNCFEKALEINCNYALAAVNKGVVLNKLKRFQEALDWSNRACLMDDNLPEAFISKGIVLKSLNRLEEAIKSFDQAISLKPEFAEAWSNRGLALYEQKSFMEAIKSFDQAISLKPEFAEAWSNKGLSLYENRKLNEALIHFNRALEIDPNNKETYWNKSLCLLLMGNFKNAWPLYEKRWDSPKASEIIGKRNLPGPTWLGGESLLNKSILIYGEQGFGDFIHFCRYVKLVAELGCRVLLEAPSELVSIFQTLDGVCQVIKKGEPLPKYDYHCSVMSLPSIFKTTELTIPANIPYLYANPDKVNYWANRLGEKTKKRVGLVWNSLSNFKHDYKRSIKFYDFIKCIPLDKFDYYCLQKDLIEEDISAFESIKIIKYFGNDLNDFSDTAALIYNLDLIVSIDTSVAHLCGALGKKTWLLLPYVPDWRWLLDREDSPWYPSIKLYRQQTNGDWNSVLNIVKLDLNRSY